MTIILVRHGITELNRARVLQPPHTPLSDVGLAQAEAVARALMQWQPAGLISSDLPRARSTADAVSRATRLPVETTELLQERNFGDLRGLPYDGMGFDPLTMTHAPPGGESAHDFQRRVDSAFAFALARRAALSGPLVVVTHGLVIRALLSGPLAVPAGRLDGLHIGNTAITVVAELPPHLVSLLNSTRHLDDGLGGDPLALSGG